MLGQSTITIAAAERENFLREFNRISKQLSQYTTQIHFIKFSKEYTLRSTALESVEVVDAVFEYPEFIGDQNNKIYIGRVERLNNEWLLYPEPGIDSKLLEVTSDRCDHCGVSRYRSSYYFFQENNEKIIKVGSSCVAAYFGYNLKRLLERWEVFKTTFERTISDAKFAGYRIEHIYAATKDATINWTADWSKNHTVESVRSILNSESALEKVLHNTTLSEVRSGLELTYREMLSHADFELCNNVLKMLKTREGDYRQVLEKKFVGQIAWAMHRAMHQEYEASTSIISQGSFITANIGDPLEVAGALIFAGTVYNNFGGVSYRYLLRGNDNNNYDFYTSKIVDDLVENKIKSIEVVVKGKFAKHWESTSQKYKNIKFNRLKGRISIKPVGE